jgi:alpha-glucosidase
VVENTTEPSLDPSTLAVSLDASGHAEGWLYDDDGEGFGYQKGDYVRIHYVADKSGNNVIVRIKGVQGTRTPVSHKVNVEVITADHKTVSATGDDRTGIKCPL